jgi:AcrR family transcriptional regulator
VPIDVDVNERLREIARATIALAEEDGIGAITIRAVATRLGGSTTLVTNYLPNRAELLANAVHHAYGAWNDEFDSQYGDTPPVDRLEALAVWSSSTSGNDAVLRRLLIELLMDHQMEPRLRTEVLERATEHHAQLFAAAVDRRVEDPSFVADVLFLVLRGFYLTSVEDPGAWTSERVMPTVRRLVELIAPVPSQRRNRTAGKRE